MPACVNNLTVQSHLSGEANKICTIFQDNATSHTNARPQLSKAGSRLRGDIKIRFVEQSADSPDMNRYDLGLYSSLWSWISKKKKMKMMTTDELWEAVTDAFYKIPGYQFEILYRVQMQILNSIVETKGGNSFKFPMQESQRRFMRKSRGLRGDKSVFAAPWTQEL